MADVEAIRQQYREARTSGDFETAARLAGQAWADAETRSAWDAWVLAFALRKLGKNHEAMVAARDGLALIADQPAAAGAVGPRLVGEFGWATYQSELKGSSRPEPARVAKAAAAVVRAWDRFNPGVPWASQFCPVPIVVNRAMKLLKEAQAWALLAGLVDATDGDRMPDDAMRAEEDRSERGEWTRAEAWYASASRALLETGNHRGVIGLVRRSDARPVPLGDHCTRWLYFRAAKSALATRNPALADEFLSRTRNAGVREWWIDALSAEAADLSGDSRAAEAHLARAFLAADQRSVPPEYLCSALDSAASVLKEGRPELAQRLRAIHRAVRESHDWNIPAQLEDAVPVAGDPNMELHALVPEWRQILRDSTPRARGVVTRLISEGSGFVRDTDGIDRYFAIPRGTAMPSWCTEGARVTFEPVMRMDQKAGVVKPAASDLEPDAPGDRSGTVAHG